MILSNDQKHTTTFGARAFVRKEETTRRGGGRDNFLLPHELLFFLFCTPAVKRTFVGAFYEEIFRRASFCCFATVSGLCNSSAFSSAFVPFAPSNFHFIRTTTNAYIIITISQRRERKREKEKGEKLFAAFPSHHRKTSSTKQKRD
jgi:hypothetical protein